MNKMMKFLAVLLCMAMLFVGCGGAKDETEAATDGATGAADATGEAAEPLTRGEYTASDYCTISEYKGLKFAEKDVAASKEAIQKEVDALIDGAKELVEVKEDRKAAIGDVVNIDYTGYVDKEAFEGGSDTGFDLELGSNRFISGFEDGLVGAKKGDELSLDLTFPDPYQSNPDLAGKAVVFEVKVNSIKEYVTPEYTDEFVAEQTEYDTIEAYEKSVSEEVRQNNIVTALAQKLFANATFADEYPPSLKKYYEDSYIRYYDSVMQSYYSTTLEEYLAATGTDKETFLEEEMGDQIKNAMQSDLILGAVAEQEKIKAEGQEYEEFLAKQAESYNMEVSEMLETYGESELQFAYVSDIAYNLIYDSIIIE